MTWFPIKATDLMPGMIVKKDPKDRGEKEHTIGRHSGYCSAGVHFGQGCYMWIGRWWVRQ